MAKQNNHKLLLIWPGKHLRSLKQQAVCSKQFIDSHNKNGRVGKANEEVIIKRHEKRQDDEQKEGYREGWEAAKRLLRNEKFQPK